MLKKIMLVALLISISTGCNTKDTTKEINKPIDEKFTVQKEITETLPVKTEIIEDTTINKQEEIKNEEELNASNCIEIVEEEIHTPIPTNESKQVTKNEEKEEIIQLTPKPIETEKNIVDISTPIPEKEETRLEPTPSPTVTPMPKPTPIPTPVAVCAAGHYPELDCSVRIDKANFSKLFSVAEHGSVEVAFTACDVEGMNTNEFNGQSVASYGCSQQTRNDYGIWGYGLYFLNDNGDVIE